KGKGKQNTAPDDPYKCDPRIKKPKVDTEYKDDAVEKEIDNPGQRVPKGKTPTKKTDCAEIAATNVHAKDRVQIEEMRLAHERDLHKMRLANERQMAKDKINAKQQAAFYQSMNGLSSAAPKATHWSLACNCTNDFNIPRFLQIPPTLSDTSDSATSVTSASSSKL
ncbi:hypothetical protein BDK51DRAFT_31406, partial [Blyttiomyces helicus]